MPYKTEVIWEPYYFTAHSRGLTVQTKIILLSVNNEVCYSPTSSPTLKCPHFWIIVNSWQPNLIPNLTHHKRLLCTSIYISQLISPSAIGAFWNTFPYVAFWSRWCITAMNGSLYTEMWYLTITSKHVTVRCSELLVSIPRIPLKSEAFLQMCADDLTRVV